MHFKIKKTGAGTFFKTDFSRGFLWVTTILTDFVAWDHRPERTFKKHPTKTTGGTQP